jgi:hypothetical protein
MLKTPQVSGPNMLRLFVDDVGGLDLACAAIDVHPATMRRWLAGTTPVPQAPLQALYWLTKWGYSDACGEAHWTHQFMLSRVRDLQRVPHGVTIYAGAAVNDADAKKPARGGLESVG